MSADQIAYHLTEGPVCSGQPAETLGNKIMSFIGTGIPVLDRWHKIVLSPHYYFLYWQVPHLLNHAPVHTGSEGTRMLTQLPLGDMAVTLNVWSVSSLQSFFKFIFISYFSIFCCATCLCLEWQKNFALDQSHWTPSKNVSKNTFTH